MRATTAAATRSTQRSLQGTRAEVEAITRGRGTTSSSAAGVTTVVVSPGVWAVVVIEDPSECGLHNVGTRGPDQHAENRAS